MQILLIDDHALFRSGLKFLLSDLDDQAQIHEASNPSEIEREADFPADLILLDWNLPPATGSTTLIRVRSLFPQATVVILSGEQNPDLVRQAVELGASGFIPKSSTPQIMVQALRLVLAGGLYLPAHILNSVAFASLSAPEPKSTLEATLVLLSDRQRSALLLAVRGKSNKEIARELKVSEGTVKQHLSTAFRLLGVSNRTEAVFVMAKQES